MLTNPKTSIWGILIFIGSALILVAHALPPLLHGDVAGAWAAGAAYWPALFTAAGGLGLVGAKDGGA